MPDITAVIASYEQRLDKARADMERKAITELILHAEREGLDIHWETLDVVRAELLRHHHAEVARFIATMQAAGGVTP